MSCQQKHYSSVLALICFSLRQFSELVLRNTYISLLQLMLSPQDKEFWQKADKWIVALHNDEF